jgi:thiol-disulfide isomerase/thioredoxin
MMKKLVLALLFALHGGGASAASRALAPHGLSNDGVNRRASGARVARHRPGAATQRGKRTTTTAKGKRDGANEAALAPVREIDADGLRKLLQRGDGQAARPLLVNFWATWCVPCRREFPDLVKIDGEYRGREIEFALVSADDVSEIKTTVPKFLRDMRAASMPAYLLNATDTQAAIAQVDPAWGGELPATFLFDRQGKLAYRHFGIIDAGKLREEINKVMSQE